MKEGEEWLAYVDCARSIAGKDQSYGLKRLKVLKTLTVALARVGVGGLSLFE
jgi:hypothetical protein